MITNSFLSSVNSIGSGLPTRLLNRPKRPLRSCASGLVRMDGNLEHATAIGRLYRVSTDLELKMRKSGRNQNDCSNVREKARAAFVFCTTMLKMRNFA